MVGVGVGGAPGVLQVVYCGCTLHGALRAWHAWSTAWSALVQSGAVRPVRRTLCSRSESRHASSTRLVECRRSSVSSSQVLTQCMQPLRRTPIL